MVFDYYSPIIYIRWTRTSSDMNRFSYSFVILVGITLSGCALLGYPSTSDSITFAWDASPGAAFYRLDRSSSPNMKESLEVVCTTADLICQDENISPGLYYYGVKAYTGSEQSRYSNIVVYRRASLQSVKSD